MSRWIKPKLIIMVKGKIEESVLCHCKQPNYPYTGPSGGSCPSWTKCKENTQT